LAVTAPETRSLIAKESPNLALHATSQSSSTVSLDQGADKALDGNLTTSWVTAAGLNSNQWLEVYFMRPTIFNKVVITKRDSFFARLRIEYWQNSQWKVLYEGEPVSDEASLVIQFPPVLSHRVRLFVINSVEPIAIREFQVFASLPTILLNRVELCDMNGLNAHSFYTDSTAC
jgi:hypothetical protein